MVDEIKSSALELIGNTPLVALDRLYPGPGRILAKCEFMNPGASVKDRSSFQMIMKAKESGELKPNAPVVEITSGNQGCGLAVVCAVLGHPLTLIMSAGNSIERAIHMEALGAKCIRVPQIEGTYGRVTIADARQGEKEAIRNVEEGAFFVKQFYNTNNPDAHYKTTGPEIWRQTAGHIDAFVATVGTAGTFTGTAKYLREKNANIQTFVVEPEGSQAIKGLPITNPFHLMQGSGYGVLPELFEYELMTDTVTVNDDDAIKYKDLLGHKEGLYVGYTSAANVAAAVKLLESGRLPENAWIVTILPDTGMKYSPLSETDN